MKIWVFTVVYNEEAMAPWFLRHYGQFADRILVWDAGSTDRTRQIFAAHPSVSLFDWPGPDGIDEDFNLHFAYDTYPSARGKADWCMWVDCDEFIYHPHLFSQLGSRAEVIRTAGFNMMGDGLPENGYWHKQIWELNPMGVSAPVYSKPIVFRPEAKVRWVRGKHALEDCAPVVSEKPLLKLLHYRYLGAAYTAAKNAKNYARCADKGPAWSCAPEFTGEHSATWAEQAKAKAFNVIEAAI
jgi:glycosyltransferase involved in cell wall biosynthesis